MAAVLTFYPRRALLEATAAGRAFQVPIYQDATRTQAWEHVFEFRPGKHTVWDHTFELPRKDAVTTAATITRVGARPGAMEVYDFPGGYAQRFDGVDKGRHGIPHSHAGPVVYVGPFGGGVFLHGSPVCNLKSCIVVRQQWDDLRRAIVGEKRLTFSVCI